jgi:hypothetical protein
VGTIIICIKLFRSKGDLRLIIGVSSTQAASVLLGVLIRAEWEMIFAPQGLSNLQ